LSVAVAGQVVVVTGAAQGLGRAVALAFAQAGAFVRAIDREEAGLATLAQQAGTAIETATADLANAGSLRRAATTLRLGEADALVHNAAILHPLPFAETSWKLWRATLDVQLDAAFLLGQAVWPGMVRRGGGMILLVSSQSGISGFVDEVPYCTAKHGLEGMMKCLAMEGAAHGILAHTITPGHSMRTPMSERNYDAVSRARWIDPARLAPAFVELARRADAQLSGQRLDAWTIAQAMQQRTDGRSAPYHGGDTP